MVAIGFGVLWLGYQQVIFGWCLLKGWNIQWRQLANPVHPYQWPPKGTDPPLIPPTQIIPGPPPGTTSTGTSTGQPLPTTQ